MNSLHPSDLVDTPWVELLPWLDEYVSDRAASLESLAPGEAWWLEDSPSVTARDVDLEKVLAELAALFVAGHNACRLSEAFPRVSPDLPSTVLRLSARPKTSLGRLTASSALSGILPHTVRDMFSVPGTSEQTVREIAYALLECAVLVDPVRRVDSAESDSDELPVLTQLFDDVLALASWRRLRGQYDKPLLIVEVDDESPEQVQELAARISALRPADLPDSGQGDPIDEIENIVDQLSARERLTLEERLLAREPITLGQLSTKLHLSKPAAGAIEAQAKAKINAACGYGTAVGNLLASLRVEIQPVASMERLIAMHPVIGSTVPKLDVPLWLVLDRLDDYFEVADGWAAAPGVAAAKKRTESLLEDLESPNGVVPVDQLAAMVTMPRDELDAWLRTCGIPVIAGSALTRTKKTADVLVGVLESVGKPRTIDQIDELAQTGKTTASLRKALDDDERAHTGADGSWRLTEWAAATETRTGNGPQFEAVHGLVRRRDTGSVKKPERTRRLHRIGLAWRYRITVTADHLRGSGFALPAGVAAAVGCERGSTVELTSRLGTQMIRWTGAQPTSGTIGRFLRELDARVGEEVLLEFSADRSFSVVRPASVPDDAEPLRRALAAIGHPDPGSIAERHVIRILADAIGMSGETRPRRLLSAYEMSSEEHVVALLELAWMHPVSANE